jgi:hypothetical protein
VLRFPGAELVRAGNDGISLRQIRANLEDLVQAELDPLIVLAGRGLGREAVQWADQALQAAIIEHKAAEDRVDTYRVALREYSGVGSAAPAPAPAAGTSRQQQSSDVQALTPQIDRTFVDRIVELQSANVQFRQEITRQMLEASIEAVKRESSVEYYKLLLSSLRAGQPLLSFAQVTERLSALLTKAKDLTARFNAVYEEMSRVSLRPGPLLYRIDQPPSSSSVVGFSLRAYGMAVLIAFALSIASFAIAALLYHHVRRFANRPAQP